METLSPLLKALETAHLKPVADLTKRKVNKFSFTPTPEECSDIAKFLGIRDVRKLTFQGELHPAAKHDWRLTAHLGASVVQECVLTLDEVTTRLEEPVLRHFSKDLSMDHKDSETETEMPEDDSIEPLGREINLFSALIEALALALPPYPRKEATTFDNFIHTEPGQAPMRDEDTRPFAGLSGLKEALEQNQDE